MDSIYPRSKNTRLTGNTFTLVPGQRMHLAHYSRIFLSRNEPREGWVTRRRWWRCKFNVVNHMVKWGTSRVRACAFVNVATRTRVRDFYTGISLESRKVDVEYGRRRKRRSGTIEATRDREWERRGEARKSSRSNCVGVYVCIEDRWLVRTQLNESKAADYAAGLEPHKSSI